ncbi:hypothetical protein AB0P15_37650 [Streptomyces sp. NPDC087917]|uniref:hypothetical protein n=1 Tax=unclassified Streptomyces TaxID=2593676 RepID=UPI0034202095
MNERRPLGTGPRPATPQAPPSAARRARLAAEGPETTTLARAGAAEHEHAASVRRRLGAGTGTDDD